MRQLPILFLLAMACGAGSPALAQEPEALRVFLDCQSFHCDFDHLRREIGFVNWVRDREVAGVHVLGTSRGTGSGGREYALAFIGRGRYAGTVDTLRYTTNTTDTEAERRDALTRALAQGLVRFVAGTPIAERITISYEAPGRDAPEERVDDPWNYWVFEIGAGASISGEEQERNYEVSGRIEANRVTENLKIDVFGRAEYERDEFDLDTTEVYPSRNIRFSSNVVWSLGPHWSAGFLVESEVSTFRNLDFALEGGPAVEFSVFPYQQSSRREMTLQYVIGLSHFNYTDPTIIPDSVVMVGADTIFFGRLRETLPRHVFEIRVGAQQPWGSVFGSLEASQFLNDLSLHRIEFDGGFNIRLFRGLRLNFFGSVARVRDQINLPAEDLPPEEILLGRRQLGTEFEYDVSVSFSYTFGSIFNNIVNPRF